MIYSSSVLERFPVEEQLTGEDSFQAFEAAYGHVRGFLERVDLQARLREAAAKGWITLPSKTRRAFTPVSLPGRPLSELLNEVRD